VVRTIWRTRAWRKWVSGRLLTDGFVMRDPQRKHTHVVQLRGHLENRPRLHATDRLQATGKNLFKIGVPRARVARRLSSTHDLTPWPASAPSGGALAATRIPEWERKQWMKQNQCQALSNS
jgi:hypothetical protein